MRPRQCLEFLQGLHVDIEFGFETARVHESCQRRHPAQVAVGRAHRQFIEAVMRILFEVRAAALPPFREFLQRG